MGTSPHTPLPIAEADFTQTGYSYTLSLIQGKHKMVILYCLMEYEPVRFIRPVLHPGPDRQELCGGRCH